MSPTSRRRWLAAAAAASVVVTVGGAYAYWTAPGAGGSGEAGTSQTQSVTLTPGTPVDRVFPGGQASVVLTVSNDGTSSVRVDSLVLDTSLGAGGFGVDGDHLGCALSALSFTTQTNAGAGWTVAPGGSLLLTLPDALAMSLDAASACQGATFVVHLTAAGA